MGVRNPYDILPENSIWETANSGWKLPIVVLGHSNCIIYNFLSSQFVQFVQMFCTE